MKGLSLSGLVFLAFSSGCFLLTGAFNDPTCGDGFLDVGEECDDGNNLAGDGCDPNCTLEEDFVPPNCGDGVENLDEGEECDDGNDIEGDGCDSNCTISACGNQIAAPGEICFIKTDLSLSGGLEPRSVTLADLDDNGELDIAVANFGGGDHNVTVFLYEGAFSFQEQGLEGIDDKLNSITAGDIDKDNLVDLVVSAEDTNGGADLVFLLLNQGDGIFQEPGPIVGVDKQNAIALGDFNNDDFLDIAIADQNTAVVAVLLQNSLSPGLFGGAVPSNVSAPPSSVAVGDFNNDDSLDIISSNGVVSLIPGNGNGTFGVRQDLTLGGSNPQQVVPIDIDNDGDLDIVTANIGSDDVSVLLNDGNGNFPAQEFAIGVDADPISVAVGDIDNDGDLDLVTANFKNNSISLLLNDNGNFVPEKGSPRAVGAGPRSVAVGDINGDGVPEIVVANEGTNSISVFFSNP